MQIPIANRLVLFRLKLNFVSFEACNVSMTKNKNAKIQKKNNTTINVLMK